jgi:hypothetical protein
MSGVTGSNLARQDRVLGFGVRPILREIHLLYRLPNMGFWWGMSRFQAVFRLLYIGNDLLSEVLQYLRLLVGSKASLAAEVLFLRKQLAFYQERKIKPHRFNDSARFSLLLLAKLFDWKNALVNVNPETLIGWHHKLFQLFWRWKSRGGRPRLAKDIRRLIVEMATNNPTWGQVWCAKTPWCAFSARCHIVTSRSHWEPAQFIAWEMLLNAKEFWPDGILANNR